MKNIYKIHYIVFFLALFFSKAIAEPTFVQSKSIETADNYYGFTFNNDGTKMYALESQVENTDDVVIEFILTTAYDISTATENQTKNIYLDGKLIATQVVFNNDGTKMFIVNHAGRKSVDEYLLSTAFDAVSYTHLTLPTILLV